MIRGFYTAAAGMIAQQRRQEMLTDNLANATTPGYKKDDASMRAFPNMLIQAMGVDNRPFGKSHHVGELTTGAYLQERTVNFLQGDMSETSHTTDFALLQGNVPVNEETGRPGALFFTVENGTGETRYSRNGNFAITGTGFLTTSEGFYVLDNAGARINVGNEDFQMTRDGLITNQAGEEIAVLNIALVSDPDLLVKEGNGLLRYEGELPVLTAIGNENVSYQLMQGFLEQSNVDAAQTMTDMTMAFRSFEANQKVLQAYDRSMEKAVNEIGRLG
jgi:flagellar basal-body rod protein FlgF